MTKQEISLIFKNIIDNLNLGISDNTPNEKLLRELFQPNSKKGMLLFCIYLIVLSDDEVVLEDTMLLSYTDCIKYKIGNPIVLMTNCLLMLGVIELIEDTPIRIRYKFKNKEVLKVFKDLEKLEFEVMKNKYLQMYENGSSKEEVLEKILKDLENESIKIKSYK